MKALLQTGFALERGTMRARATLQDPDVRAESSEERGPQLTIDEGGVVLELAFPDWVSIRRFQRRIAGLCLPDGFATDGGAR
jgi:hypothetical protein